MLEVLYNRISLNLIASNLVFCIIRICNQSVYLSRVNVRERRVKITFFVSTHDEATWSRCAFVWLLCTLILWSTV